MLCVCVCDERALTTTKSCICSTTLFRLVCSPAAAVAFACLLTSFILRLSFSVSVSLFCRLDAFPVSLFPCRRLHAFLADSSSYQTSVAFLNGFVRTVQIVDCSHTVSRTHTHRQNKLAIWQKSANKRIDWLLAA